MSKDFHTQWQEFGNIPINDDDEIEASFLHFPVGENRFAIWSWFERIYDITLGEIIYYKQTPNI